MSERPLHPNLALTSYWRASWDRTPVTLVGRPWELRKGGPVGHPDRCACCGSSELTLHSATDQSGTAWRQYYAQYQCGACQAYSVFHFDD